mmetsp:Transcript_8337/g.12839  ORF Transcript_8337/g.12839 Transcript_8337/m.12839 type:complete len:104 (+) Transcript_8337:56-367(+)
MIRSIKINSVAMNTNHSLRLSRKRSELKRTRDRSHMPMLDVIVEEQEVEEITLPKLKQRISRAQRCETLSSIAINFDLSDGQPSGEKCLQSEGKASNWGFYME